MGVEHLPDPTPEELAACPFCGGREDRTPPETLRLGADPWRVRVVPNLYPAFERQEVVVHLPEHTRSLVELSPADLELVAEAWRQRSAAAGAAGFPYVHAFINEGHGAGASLPHSHSQLVWLRDDPPSVVQEGGAGACRLCALVASEVREGDRLLLERDGLVALCAPAGRGPYEMLVAPLTHDANGFGAALGPALSVTADLIAALRAIEGAVAWNAWLHLGAHWHLEILPRMTAQAGVELGAGISVLTVAPEDAAAALRAHLEAVTASGAAR